MSTGDEPRNEIELLSDGNGLAIFGEQGAVERFLFSAGVPSRDLQLTQKLGSMLKAGSATAQSGSEVAANAGRWVKLTDESAKALKFGNAMKGSSDNVSRTIVTTSTGKATHILEFLKQGSVGSMLTNPAILAGAAGLMAQFAMQQTMEEITEYLEVIDEKVDDILRAQKDASIARMIGVGLVIDDALLKREHVGRVSEVTWSSVQGAAQTIAETQSYALRRIDVLAEKLEEKSNVGDIAELAKDAEQDTEEWLAVLARCFQLQDALALLELDRVLDSSPDELDRHRAAINAGRAKRRELIATSTERLLDRIDVAAMRANSKVLLHPLKPAEIVRSSNEVGSEVAHFHATLGIKANREDLAEKRWSQAAGEVRDTVLSTGSAGLRAGSKLSHVVAKSVKSTADRVTDGLARRVRRGDHDDKTPLESKD